MNDGTFQTRLVQWATMPGDLEEYEYFLSVYPAPLDARFTALSELYLAGNPQQQTRLRQCFASGGSSVSSLPATFTRFDNALIYMRRISRCLSSVTDCSLLRFGLAVATCTEGRVDEHDLLVSLAFLYHAATRAGIDPVPFYEAVAATAEAQAQQALQAFLHCEASTARRIVQHYEGTC